MIISQPTTPVTQQVRYFVVALTEMSIKLCQKKKSRFSNKELGDFVNLCLHRFIGIIGIDTVHKDNAWQMVSP